MASFLKNALASAKGATFTVAGTTISATDCLALLGAAMLTAHFLKVVLSALSGIKNTVLPRRKLTSYGEWAVVTGATDVGS